MTLLADVFAEIRFPKNMVSKYLKRRVSEDPYRDNKANGSKHCCNLNGRTSTIFINHCEGSFIEKSLF